MAKFESAFGMYYSAEGRPAKPVRLKVGLLLLKLLFNQGDEPVVAGGGRTPAGNTSAGWPSFNGPCRAIRAISANG